MLFSLIFPVDFLLFGEYDVFINRTFVLKGDLP